jgi:hypothetical protein
VSEWRLQDWLALIGFVGVPLGFAILTAILFTPRRKKK